MKLKKIITGIIVCAMLAGCAGNGSSPFDNLLTKENVGTITGAAGGALMGSAIGKGKGNVLAVATGTLLGAALGKSIGASLDRADVAYYQQTSQSAMENARTGTSSSWSNPDTGHAGTVTPTRTFQTASGRHCREYTQTITVDGRTERAYGSACRQTDGTWQLVQR